VPTRAEPESSLSALPEFLASITPQRLTLTLPVPPSINHQYATVHGRRLLSSAGRGYKSTVAQQVLLALARSPHKEALLRALRGSSLTLSIHFYFSSPLRRDVDGGLKIAQDALCEALGLNDNRIVEIHLYKSRDAHQPRIEMTLGSCS
jgi:crossover junction endodeoxyribonuclease RusA